MKEYNILSFQFLKNKTREQGITVISLIISIVIITIISAITINSFVKNEKTIDYTLDTAEEYAVTNYKEQVSELLETIIKKNEITGDETNLQQIASEMNNETWIKYAVAGQDIIITTENGYVFEVYYSEEYGQRFVEYLGREDSGTIPNITATYDKQTQNITITSNDAKTIELLYNGEIVKTSNGTSLSYIAQKTGWYAARAISNSGNTRYAWVRAAVDDLSVNLEVTSVGILDNGWYGQDNVPVQVKISTNGSKIYYKLGIEGEYTEVLENITTVSINTNGKTMIYAYTVDANGNESDVSSLKVRFDNTKPILGEIVLTGDVRDSGIYKSDVIISLDNATDTGSGIDGYSWWIVDENASNETYVKGIDKTITVSSEGTKKIGLQLKDKAGNLSDIQTVTVTKEKFSVGDYVSYTPTTGKYDLITNSDTYAGTIANTSDFTTETFNWRIWSIEGDTLTLIADDVTKTGGTSNNGTLSLYGAVGYNNGVKIMNDICKNCYSNSSLGATGRSLSIKDIENVLDTTVWKPENSGAIPYNETKTYYTYGEEYTYTENKSYPYIWQFEEYAKIVNTDETIENAKDEGINRSTQPENKYYPSNSYSMQTADISLNVIKTVWDREFRSNNFINGLYYNLIFILNDGETYLPRCWLASRGVELVKENYSGARFNFQRTGNNVITIWAMCSSAGDVSEQSYSIRPMVAIDLSVANLGQIGLGTAASPYSLEAR